MFKFRKAAAPCFAAALIAGSVLNTGGIQAFAATGVDDAFTAEIIAEAQAEDGSVLEVNNCIQEGASLEVTPDSLTLEFRVKGEAFVFPEIASVANRNVLYKESGDTSSYVLRTYSFQIADVSERILVNSPDNGLASEFYLALIADDEVLDHISSVYTGESSSEEASESRSEGISLFAMDIDSEEIEQDSEESDENISFSTFAATSAEATEDDGTTLSLLASSALADGEYTITVEAREMDSDAVHTRNEDIDSNAKITVTDGQIYLYFSSTGREFTFKDGSGNFVNMTESSYTPENSEIRSDGVNLSTVRNYKVAMSSLSDTITARFPAASSASGALEFRIVPIESTLATVSLASTTSDNNSSGTDTNSDTSNNSDSSNSNSRSSGSGSSGSSSTSPKTGDELPIAFIVLALASAGGVVGCTAVYFKRRKGGELTSL